MSSWKEQRIESAAIDVTTARDAAGLYVNLCHPMDVHSVRAAIVNLSKSLEPGWRWIHDDGELAAARNLRKLVTLLEAHLS